MLTEHGKDVIAKIIANIIIYGGLLGVAFFIMAVESIVDLILK